MYVQCTCRPRDYREDATPNMPLLGQVRFAHICPKILSSPTYEVPYGDYRELSMEYLLVGATLSILWLGHVRFAH